MVYGIGQSLSNPSAMQASLTSGGAFTQLAAQWQQWANEGSIAECRGVALERLQECLAQQSSCLDLSDLFLDCLPDRLPEHVAMLNVAGNRLACLPDHLPSGLETLDVSDNQGLRLTHIPEGLRELEAERINLQRLPALPNSLIVCNVAHNDLRHLPDLPASLRTLEAGRNQLRELPDLPASLKYCDVPYNKIKRLPVLPAALIELDVSENRLKRLPDLHGRLERLDVSGNDLRALPRLPASLQCLYADRNSLEALDDLPESLTELDIRDNELVVLPERVIGRIAQLRTAALRGNWWRPDIDAALERARSDRSGPSEPTINASPDGQARARPLLDAVEEWLPAEGADQALIAWSEVSNDERSVRAFSAFLDRLGYVAFAKKNPAFQTAVGQWLIALGQDPAMRQASFELAYDATQTCEDRVALTWNQLQRLSLSHAISGATPDTPKDQLLQWVREVCALSLLEEIAATKVEEMVLKVRKAQPYLDHEQARSKVEEIEVHLAYPTSLAKKLDLRTPVRNMKFGALSGVKAADLEAASAHVTAFLNGPKFHAWLNNWEPWQTALEKLYPQQYAEAHEMRSDFYSDPDLHSKAVEEIKLIENVTTDHQANQILATYLTDKFLAPLTRLALAPVDKAAASHAPVQIESTRL